MGIADLSKELRSWIILVIVLAIISLVGYSYGKNYINNKNKQINDLEEKLREKPKVEIKYQDKIVEKEVVKYKDRWRVKTEERVVYKEPSLEVEKAFLSYCVACEKENIAPLISIDALRFKCTANICNQEESECDVQEGYTIVKEKEVKDKIAKISVIGGYEFFNKGMVIGTSFIDYKGITVGTDIVTDFETAENSGVGLFAGYRPETGKWKTNLMIGGGVVSHFHDFSEVGAQVFLGVNLIDRE
jgi:hypothetical protein